MAFGLVVERRPACKLGKRRRSARTTSERDCPHQATLVIPIGHNSLLILYNPTTSLTA
jgi:hypothetical protein